MSPLAPDSPGDQAEVGVSRRAVAQPLRTVRVASILARAADQGVHGARPHARSLTLYQVINRLSSKLVPPEVEGVVMARRAANTAKLEAATGFRCTTTLEETIDRMIEYARELVHIA